MKVLKILICVFLALILLYNASVKIISENDTLAVKVLESIYQSNKTIDDLSNLCSVLSYTTFYEEKVEYFGVLIEYGYADSIAENNYSNSKFHQNYYVNGYKFEYCIALLHLNEYDSFEKYYSENVNNLQEQNLFYNILFYELKYFDWTEAQLECLQKAIMDDVEKEYFNDELIFENNCIKAEIFRLTDNQDGNTQVDQLMLDYISDKT